MQTSRAAGTLQLFCCSLPLHLRQVSRLQCRRLQTSMQAAAQQQLLLTDAHCHPQLDPANMAAVRQLRSNRLAAMSVSYDVDWDIMLQLHKLAGAWGQHLYSFGRVRIATLASA